jgi:hypothetical protein
MKRRSRKSAETIGFSENPREQVLLLKRECSLAKRFP